MPDRRGWGRGGKLKTGQPSDISGGAKFEEPTVFTIQFDVQQGGTIPQPKPSPPMQSATACFAQAQIIWTLNGISMTRTCDIAAGVSISGMAESVRVIINDVTPSAYPQNVEYLVSFTVSTHPRPTTAVPPVLTGVSQESIGPTATSGIIPVPHGANSVAIFGINGDGSSPTLELQLQATLTGTGGELPATGTPILSTAVTVGAFVPLIAGTGFVTVTNTSASKTATITVVFGIDG